MKTKIFGLLVVGLLAGPMAANASTISIYATSLSSQFGNFSASFADLNGDGFFGSNEQTAFSGVYNYEFGRTFLNTLRGTPIIDRNGVGAGGWSFFVENCGDFTCFSQDSYGSADEWTYQTTYVPEPGTLALLGLGLAGLGLSRRRKGT